MANPVAFHAKREEEDDKQRNQVYEFNDVENDNLVVTAFKKISYSKPHVRLNCFVTSFPFSGHSELDRDNKEVPAKILS